MQPYIRLHAKFVKSNWIRLGASSDLARGASPPLPHLPLPLPGGGPSQMHVGAPPPPTSLPLPTHGQQNEIQQKLVGKYLVYAILVGFPQAPIIGVLAPELRCPAEPALISKAHDCVSSCQHLQGRCCGSYTISCWHTFLIPASCRRGSLTPAWQCTASCACYCGSCTSSCLHTWPSTYIVQ